MKNLRTLLLYCFVLTLIIPLCVAEIGISVSSYDPVSKLAKIKITNTDQTAYSELKISIDGSTAMIVADQLNAGNSALTPQIIEPGMHNIVLTTKEGKTVTKSLNFAKSEEQVQQETNQTEELTNLRRKELANESTQNQEQLNKDVLEELKKMNETEETKSQVQKGTQVSEQKTEGSFFKKYYSYGAIVFISLLILAVIYLFLIKKFLFKKTVPENFEKPQQTMPEDKKEQEEQILFTLQQGIQKTGEGYSYRKPETVEEQKPLERKRPLLTRDISSLIDCFVNLIKEGYSQEQIIQSALSAGWEKEEIEEALKEAETRRGKVR